MWLNMDNMNHDMPSMMVDHDYLSGKTERPADVTHKMLGVKSLISEAMQSADENDSEYLEGALQAIAEGNIEQATAYIAVATSLDRATRGQITSEIKALAEMQRKSSLN